MKNTFQIDELKHLLVQKIGLRIPPDAQTRFVGTLHERATQLGYSTLEEYKLFLVSHTAAMEWEEFVRAFTSVETFFFRDNGQQDLLRLRLLPELITRHQHNKTLRLWSAGCASGEEAYSLAILLDFLLPERSDWNILILGTDIDSKAVAKAQQARYGQWSFRMVPAALQQRYFKLESDEWVLNERIRKMVTFRVGNLVGDIFPDSGKYLHNMDLILCRNVFIYFDAAAVSAVAAKFSATLAEDGYLMTSHTELSSHQVRGLESRLFTEGVVYQRHAHGITNIATLPLAAGEAIQMPATLSTPAVKVSKDSVFVNKISQTVQPLNPAMTIYASARTYADQGEYEKAERMCRKALASDPSLASAYFLLAQLAQLKGNFNQAKECLNKTIYLDQRCVAAYLELAALCEREGNLSLTQTLRHTALEIVRTIPDNEQIEQYERTAGELAQWLEQWESSGNNPLSSDGDQSRSVQNGQ